MIVKGNTIINHTEYAFYFDDDDQSNEIKQCVILSDKISFWSSPLNWLAIWILIYQVD